jgi:hypothetical protein
MEGSKQYVVGHDRSLQPCFYARNHNELHTQRTCFSETSQMTSCHIRRLPCSENSGRKNLERWESNPGGSDIALLPWWWQLTRRLGELSEECSGLIAKSLGGVVGFHDLHRTDGPLHLVGQAAQLGPEKRCLEMSQTIVHLADAQQGLGFRNARNYVPLGCNRDGKGTRGVLLEERGQRTNLSHVQQPA